MKLIVQEFSLYLMSNRYTELARGEGDLAIPKDFLAPSFPVFQPFLE